MTVWAGIALGALQGATEFLPISSSGHLVVARALLGVAPPGASLETWLHLGTLVAVVLGYSGPLGAILRGLAPGGAARPRASLLALVVASVPAAVLGLLARNALESTFNSPNAAAAGLLATSCLLTSLLFVGRRPAEGADAGAGEPPAPGLGRALLIGIAQALALMPGLSRSGSTIVAGRWLGLSGSDAASFSFLLSLPAVLGAAVLELGGHGLGAVWTVPGIAGAVTSAGVGYVALRLVQRLVQNDRLALFAPYTLAVAALVIGRW